MRLLCKVLVVWEMMASVGCTPWPTSPPSEVDAGTADIGAVDIGALDTGAPDTGAMGADVIGKDVIDAGGVGTDVIDAGVADADAMETEVLDAGVVDAGVVDAGGVGTDADIGIDAFIDTGADIGVDAGPRMIVLEPETEADWMNLAVRRLNWNDTRNALMAQAIERNRPLHISAFNAMAVGIIVERGMIRRAWMCAVIG